MTARSVTWAWNEPNSFRGLKFGEDITKQIHECPKNGGYQAKDTCYERDSTPQNVKLKTRAVDLRVLQIWFHDSLHTLSLHDHAWQLDGKLASLKFTFVSGAFDEWVELCEKKYGPPTLKFDLPWTSKAGVKVTQHVMTWAGQHVSITLKSVDEKVDEGSGDVETEEMQSYLKEYLDTTHGTTEQHLKDL